MIQPYEGSDPYVFVSYSHADEDTVVPIVEMLQMAGYRIWYDAGIGGGSVSTTRIGLHVDSCAGMIAFLSPAYAESWWCQDEVQLAYEQHKHILPVVMEDVELVDPLRFHLSRFQRERRSDYPSDCELLRALKEAPFMGQCLRRPVRDALRALESPVPDEENLRDALDALQALPENDWDEGVENLKGQIRNRLEQLELERQRVIRNAKAAIDDYGDNENALKDALAELRNLSGIDRDPKTMQCIKEIESRLNEIAAGRRGYEGELGDSGESGNTAQMTLDSDVESGLRGALDGVKALPESSISERLGRFINNKRVRICLLAFVVAVVGVTLLRLLNPPVPGVAGTLMPDEVDTDTIGDAANERVFGTKYKRRQISSVTFMSTMPTGMDEEGWDVSREGDGSVLAWFEENAGGYYDMTIAAKGKILAPESCHMLFCGYEEARSVHFNGVFDTSGAKDMSYMFAGCSSLGSVDVSCFSTSKVENMRSMFQGCGKLPSLEVSGFDTSMVTNMRQMFDRCSKLESLDVSHFDTSKVTNMGWMFYGCPSLTTLDVSKFDTSRVIEMSAVFCGCSALTILDVSNFDTSEATDVHGMFEKCSSLTSLNASGFRTGKVENMSNFFSGCTSLTSIDVSHFDTSRVTNMRAMFSRCSLLDSVAVRNFDTSSVTDMGWMFYGCSSLTSLDVSGFDTSDVTSMHEMFDGCSMLKSLDVSSFDTSAATDIAHMFCKCSLLEMVDVSGFKTSNVTTMQNTFYKCTSLTTLDLSGWDVSALSDEEAWKDMFGGTTSSLEIHRPAGDEAWDTLVGHDLGGTPTFVEV